MRVRLGPGVFALGLLAVSLVHAEDASPVGRWVLVEQRYEAGGKNLASPDRPVRLEILREGAGVAARVWAGDDRSAAVAWPAFVVDRGPLPVEIVEPVLREPDGTIRVRYRVRPSPDDDLVLDIRERYRPGEDGRALSGTMTVEFTGGERNRGGYTLHRRFEREP